MLVHLAYTHQTPKPLMQAQRKRALENQLARQEGIARQEGLRVTYFKCLSRIIRIKRLEHLFGHLISPGRLHHHLRHDRRRLLPLEVARWLSRAELLQAADCNEVMQGGCHRW